MIAPSFSTEPVAPARSSRCRPAMKSSFEMLWVLATNPPTSTDAVLPKRMPWGFNRNTCPGAVIRPKIWDGFESSTRLRVALSTEGCMKFTVDALPTSKVFQSITARCVDCPTFMTAPAWEIDALPATTWPPVGSCIVLGGGKAGSACDAAVRAAPAANALKAAPAAEAPVESERLPRERVFSAATTQRSSLQTRQ